MKYVIVRREANGNKSVVVSKNTLGEIQKIWKKYLDFARKNGWIIIFNEPIKINIGDYIEDITTRVTYSLEAH